jgi:hypothetical protein
MKNYQSTIENTWIELKTVELTEEQTTLLMSKEESDKEAKEALIQEIKAEREQPALESDAEIFQKIYESIKPTLKEGQTYQLIAVNAFISEGKISGILNCRVSGEHKQIRF